VANERGKEEDWLKMASLYCIPPNNFLIVMVDNFFFISLYPSREPRFDTMPV
jgi:hypothetical protein